MAAESKVDWVIKACVYKIGTGAWEPGDRLPSLRQGARTWSVDQLTVRRAYQRLEEMGLVHCRPQSGYYLAQNRAVDSLTLHAPTIERFYAEFAGRIEAESKLSVLGVFRFLAMLAEERAARSPEYAFVECTKYDTKHLAGQIAARVGAPCAAFVVDELLENPLLLPDHVRILVTTAFHARELSDPKVAGTRPVVLISATLAPGMMARVIELGPQVHLFCLDPEQGEHVADDIRAFQGGLSLSFTIAAGRPENIDAAVQEVLGSPDSPPQGCVVVLSTTLWEAVDERWRDCERVLPYVHDIDDASAARLAAAIGLPLGVQR
jgi:DNA-binding transcriptional regulator YhcF (GntR family)